MAGMQVPLVLIPRYTTYCGASGQSFETIGMDVTEYEQANVSLWRTAGKDLTTFTLAFQESMDQLLWSSCAGGPFVDPGATTEGPFQPVFSKRWFRLVITLTGTSPVVTCWCLGFLVQRES